MSIGEADDREMAVKKKKTATSAVDNMQHYMKIVTSDVCMRCTQQCQRGLAYMEKMEQPGAIGHGVPCILTKGNQVQDKKQTKKK